LLIDGLRASHSGTATSCRGCRHPSGRQTSCLLARLLYECDWDRQRIVDLFAVIDWLLRLPQDLERQL